MRRPRPSKGFTLVEVVIVLAIIGILMAMATAGSNRIRDRRTVEHQMGFIQSRVERAQSMAAVAGSRLGTNRLVFNGSCTAPGGVVAADGTNPLAQLWMRVDGAAGTIQVPDRYTVAGPLMTIFCRTFLISQEPETGRPVTAQFVPASMVNTLQFAFSSSGRLVLPGAPAVPFVYIESRIDLTRPNIYGLRIMPSGVTCKANGNNVAAPCDEEP